ncbi:MAG: hypothetical protein B5M53_07315 [Candidatus Cloacimonas sp. 4484_209]|nr:MAG: hypothetical protein B5M53_07315 [Candidatus Cloacimonas sp. 4484_209]
MDKKNIVFEFLSKFFSQLNENKVTYCILRNYDNLPEAVGNDLDIWVKDGDQREFQKVLFETSKNLGWDIIKYSRSLNCHGEGNYPYFIVKNGPVLSIIHIDCWVSIHWRALTYVNEKIFPECLLFHKQGFYIPSPGIEASINLLKDLLYHGEVREKYNARIIEYSNRDPEGFLKALERPFGKKIAEFILSMAKAGEWGKLGKNRNFLRWMLFRKALFNEPFLQLKRWNIYFYGQMKKFLFPNRGLFLALIGPDGSGKTTMAKAILQSKAAKKIFQKKLYFHGHFPFLPELKKIVWSLKLSDKKSQIIPIRNSIDNSKPFGFFRSMIYPIYYGLNYFLGHLLVWKEKAIGSLIVFDRYFYDYFVQKPYLRCPRWLLSVISKIIPKPDIIIYLKNSPEIIHRRKSELDQREIERQTREYEQIAKRFPDGFIVETSSNPESVVEKIQYIIIQKIKEKQWKYKP